MCLISMRPASIPSWRARAASRSRSPSTTNRAGHSRSFSRRQMSGPIPAGSPEVTAITGSGKRLTLFDAVLDIGAIADLPDPVLIGLVGLAIAQYLPCGEPLAFVGDIFGATLQHLDQMEAEG